MTRVLMLAPTPFFSDRGCHVRIYEQARFLSARGFEVCVLTYPLGDDPPGVKVVRSSHSFGFKKLDPGPSWTRPLADGALLKHAFSLAREFKPRLIHAHLHEGCLLGLFLRGRVKAPLLFDYQGSLSGESIQHGFIRAGSLLHLALSKVETWLDQAPDMVCVSSGSLLPELSRRGVSAEVIADWVDPEAFKPGPPEEELFRELGLVPGIPVAAYLGVLSVYQGADILIKAASILREQGVKVQFLVMGYPERTFKEQAEKAGLSEMVKFTGRLSYFQAGRYLRLAAVALAPKLARTEGNGKVLLYMASGLPVIAFDLPVNRELLAEHAVWVQPSSSREECAARFAQAISSLLRDEGKRRELAKAGRARAAENFAPAVQGAKLIELYQKLMA